jgi:hypothetical protein
MVTGHTLQVSQTVVAFQGIFAHDLSPGTIAGSVNLIADSSPSAFRNNGIAGAPALGSAGPLTHYADVTAIFSNFCSVRGAQIYFQAWYLPYHLRWSYDT